MLGDILDGADDRALFLCLGVEQLKFLQGEGGQIGAGPSAKVLGSDLFAGDFAQIVVDVRRVDCVPIAVLVEVLEELVTGNILTAPDNVRQPLIGEIDPMPDPALPLELKRYRGALDRFPERGRMGACVPVAAAMDAG